MRFFFVSAAVLSSVALSGWSVVISSSLVGSSTGSHSGPDVIQTSSYFFTCQEALHLLAMIILLYQIATPDLKPVPVVAIIIQVLRHHVGVVEGLVHAVLAVLVVPRWCHVPSRPPTSPIVPGQQFLRKSSPPTHYLLSLENSLGTVGSGPKFTPFLLAT